MFQALAEAGIAPDWVIGTSIGAINAALIVGNLPERRLERLTEFWSDIRRTGLAGWMGAARLLAAALGTAVTVAGGLPGFFEPNPAAPAVLSSRSLAIACFAPAGNFFSRLLQLDNAGRFRTAMRKAE